MRLEIRNWRSTSLVTAVPRRAHTLGHWGFNGHRTLCEPQHPIIVRLPDCHKRIGYRALLLPFALIETVVRVGLGMSRGVGLRVCTSVRVRALLDNARPGGCRTSTPSGRYNLVVIGSSVAGQVAAIGAQVSHGFLNLDCGPAHAGDRKGVPLQVEKIPSACDKLAGTCSTRRLIQ